MTKNVVEITNEFVTLQNEPQSAVLMGFFKCGKGEYGEGDRFLGIKVPQTREIVKRWSGQLSETDITSLLQSEWHEIRLAGFLFLVDMFKKAEKLKNKKSADEIVCLYVDNLSRCNNWDLVDLSAPYILGRYACHNPKGKSMIRQLSNDQRLWHRRAGVVSTLALIREGMLYDIFEIAPSQFAYRHDLIHKATGWMLREAGKKDEKRLRHFLDSYEADMPRITYRYATEIIKKKEKEKLFEVQNR